MRPFAPPITLALPLFVLAAAAAAEFQTDAVPTSQGDLQITFIGHGTLMFQFAEKVVHVDPVGRYADYSQLPKADLILVTHEHGDHLDKQAIDHITKENTRLILTAACAERIGQGTVMKNGDVKTHEGLRIEATPAYNVVHMRGPGQPFHPRGSGNGYVIDFGDKRVYVAGDTENVPEMAKLEKIHIAFLPMNLPYTMTPEMAAEATRAIKPSIVYPYHFGDTDTSQLVGLLKDLDGVEVRIRNLK